MPPETGRAPSSALLAATGATIVLMAGQALRLPSPLRDAATGEYLTAYSLHVPADHLLTTPFSALADMVTLNSARQDRVLIAWILAAYWLWILRRWKTRPPRPRDLAGYALYLAAVAAWLAWAVLWPRPAVSLHAADPDDLIVDFHSHTSYSWDGRRSFTPAANMAWHRRTGFDAAFVTDHNTMAGAQEAKELSRSEWISWLQRREGASGDAPYRSLEGEEVSLHDTHVGVLGNRVEIDHTLYDKDLDGVFRFLREAPRYRGLPFLSLPEYWLHHPRARWEEFARSGASGFEIVNSVPKALDFPQELRRDVVELCRARDLFVLGVSDNHGWGSAAAVWNVMNIPGQRTLNPDELQDTVLATLLEKRFRAVRVIERVKQEPLAMPWILADPLLGAWTLCRTFSWPQTWACVAWAWLAALARLAINFLPRGR